MRNAHKLDNFVQRLKHECALTKTDIEDLLGCALIGKADHLPVTNISQLLDKLHVSFEAVHGEQIDFNVIRSRLANKPHQLAERYVKGVQTSSRFTGAYMADYVREKKGVVAVNTLHKHFQFDASHVSDHSLSNNILFPRDICNYVAKYYGLQEVEDMGQHSIKLLGAKLEKLKLRFSRSWQDYVVKFITEITPQQVERNYVWDIYQVTSSSVFVRGRASEEFTECFPSLVTTSPALERLRLGYMRGLLSYFDHNSYEVTQCKSVSHGDSFDLYQLTRVTGGQQSAELLQ